MFSVEVKDGITPALDALSRSAGDILQQLVVEMSEMLTPFMQQNAPVGRHFDLDGTMRTGGELRDSLHFVIGQWGSYLAGAKQGVYVAAGTDPHPIAATNAPRLAFYWEKYARIATPQVVNHPGQKKNDFRTKGLQQAFDENAVENVITRIMDQWMNQIE